MSALPVWIDTHTLARSPAPGVTRNVTVVHAPTLPRAVLVEPDGRVELVSGGVATAKQITRDTSHARFVDDRRLAVLERFGKLSLHDLDSGTSRALEIPAGTARSLHTGADSIVVVYEDARVVRVDLANDRRSGLTRIPQVDQLVIAPDGRVFFADRTALLGWSRDNKVATRATFSSPIRALYVAGGQLAVDTDDSAYLLANTRPRRRRACPPRA